MSPPGALARRLETGPGMRVQRIVEAGFLLAAFLTGDVRWAYVTFASTVAQAVSPWLVPIALAVAAVRRGPVRPRVSDIYYDMAGSRGACAISVVVQAAGLALIHIGPAPVGWLVLAIPAGSFILSPTVGFCAGCTLYVWLRELFTRLGWKKGAVNGIRDVDVDEIAADRK